jgi:hypothetical protein
MYCEFSAPAIPFITRVGNRLFEGTEPFRFISYNIPNLHYLEDRPSGRTAPTYYEQFDAIRSIAKMGGRVARTYVLSIVPFNETNTYMSYGHIARFPNATVLRPPGVTWVSIPNSLGLFINEELFVVLDTAIAIAGQHQVRLIIPFIDRWTWWGGIEVFANLFNVPGSQFFTNSVVRQAYRQVVAYVMNRVNTVTGVRYKDDPTILCWETGNELFQTTGTRTPAQWTIDVARYIKSLDSRHLVMDGSYGYYGWPSAIFREASIDILTNHYYQVPFPTDSTILPKPVRTEWTYAGRILNEARYAARFQKAFIVGETGLAPMSMLTDAVNAAQNNVEVAGLLMWSLRYHSRDGGFCKNCLRFCYDTMTL